MLEIQPLGVPVIVETLSRTHFAMIRCQYLSLECDYPSPNWYLDLWGEPLPFSMLNLVGIVRQPLGSPLFSSPSLIEEFFVAVEDRSNLTVNFEDIWLPQSVFRKLPAVGDVFRLHEKLFTRAYQFRNSWFEESDYSSDCGELSKYIEFSEEETKAFNEWSFAELARAVETIKAHDLQLKVRR